MNVSASTDRFPPERPLVAMETPEEEIKKRQSGGEKHVGFFFFFLRYPQNR